MATTTTRMIGRKALITRLMSFCRDVMPGRIMNQEQRIAKEKKGLGAEPVATASGRRLQVSGNLFREPFRPVFPFIEVCQNFFRAFVVVRGVDVEKEILRAGQIGKRSEERRVGKECRSRWS